MSTQSDKIITITNLYIHIQIEDNSEIKDNMKVPKAGGYSDFLLKLNFWCSTDEKNSRCSFLNFVVFKPLTKMSHRVLKILK